MNSESNGEYIKAAFFVYYKLRYREGTNTNSFSLCPEIRC